MTINCVLLGSGIAILTFLIMWLRERRRANIEYVAYGLRADEDTGENTKTNITQMEASFVEAITRLQQLGEVYQDDWGHWIWTKTGKPLGTSEDSG